MFGGLSNLTGILKSAQQMKGKMDELQQEMAARRYAGSAGGDQVTAVVNGKLQLVDIKINPAAVGDVELLEDLIKAAIGIASEKAQEGAREEMSKLAGGLNLPAGVADMLGNMQPGGQAPIDDK